MHKLIAGYILLRMLNIRYWPLTAFKIQYLLTVTVVQSTSSEHCAAPL